jgi:hypothetical protein
MKQSNISSDSRTPTYFGGQMMMRDEMADDCWLVVDRKKMMIGFVVFRSVQTHTLQFTVRDTKAVTERSVQNQNQNFTRSAFRIHTRLMTNFTDFDRSE